MGLRCSLLGHDFGDVVVERDREVRGAEVVVTERELRECRRCGAESVVSENTEVRRLHPEEAAADDEGDPDASDEGSGPPKSDAPDDALSPAEPDAPDATDGPTDATADVSGTVEEADASADARDDAVIIDAETEETVGGGEAEPAEAAGSVDDAATADTAAASVESGTDDAVVDTTTDDAAVDSTSDDAAEIVDSGPEDDADEGAQEPATSPDEATAESVAATPEESPGEEGTDAEFVAEGAEDPDADSMWGDSAVASRDEIAKGRDPDEGVGAADDGWESAPTEPDDEPMTAEEWAETTAEEESAQEATADESVSRWPDDPREEAEDQAADSGFEFGEPVGNGSATEPRSGIESAGPIESTGTSDDLSGALTCPACGFAVAMANSSLRAGDICPECHDGYLAEDR